MYLCRRKKIVLLEDWNFIIDYKFELSNEDTYALTRWL